MTIALLRALLWLLAPVVAVAAPAPTSFSFEEAVLRSDRIVVATVLGASGETVDLPGGGEIVLGIKDSGTGLVFTLFRVRISACLFDPDASCRAGDSEVLVPGGTVYESVDGVPRLRTWEVAGAAGAPLAASGDDVLLFLTKRNGRYLPLNDRGARVRVDRSQGTASVVLRFDSPRFLSAEGRDAARARDVAGNPATTPPVFIESVPLDRLKDLIGLARQVPKPTSGIRHANPERAAPHTPLALGVRGIRIRAGDDADGRETSLGVRDDLDSAHRTDDGRWTCGP